MSESHSQNFNHLKIHTQYSICEGAARIDDLQEYSKKNKIKSLGLCDTSNLCGALEFAEKISKSGTQPIIGTQINFKIGETIGLLPLFALNEVGYKNIIELSSLSYLKNDELSDPHLDFELLFDDAISYAENGFPVSELIAYYLNLVGSYLNITYRFILVNRIIVI